MQKAYVEQRDGGYLISGTRISLDSIVYAYKRGAAPESIQRAFPLATLEEIYGAITFYLAHQQEVDAYLAQTETTLKAQAQAMNAACACVGVSREPHFGHTDRLTRPGQNLPLIRIDPITQYCYI